MRALRLRRRSPTALDNAAVGEGCSRSHDFARITKRFAPAKRPFMEQVETAQRLAGRFFGVGGGPFRGKLKARMEQVETAQRLAGCSFGLGAVPFRRKLKALILSLLGLALLAPLASAEVVHRERSLYQTILVIKQGRTLCLQFSLRRVQRNQSCLDERRPERMILAYTRMMMAALLFGPQPQRVLVVGLGGGTMPMTLAAIYPEAQLDVVEIDPVVVKVAKRHFGFAESERLTVHVEDARVFTRRAVAAGRSYDLIMLDAFGADYIPEHLMTREYLADTRALLTGNGALAANTFAISQLYDHESATYFDVFGPFFNLKVPSSGNRVILATKEPLPSLMTLNARAEALAKLLAPYGIKIRDYPRRLKSEIDWAADTRVLTDQYAPANLLQAQ